MNKYKNMILKALGIAGFIGISAVTLYAVSNVTQLSSSSFTDGKRSLALKELVDTDIPALVTAVNQLLVPQSNTATTLITPRYRGEICIVTGQPYVAIGFTTNNWVNP